MQRQDFQEIDAESVHGSFRPQDVRPGQSIKAWMRPSEADAWAELRIWRFSPLGIDIVDSDALQNLTVGTEMYALTQVGTQKLSGKIVLVATVQEGDTIIRSFRYVYSPSIAEIRLAHRGEERFICHDIFYPTAFFENYAKLHDKIWFKICDISTKGMRLETSLRNKFLQVGLRMSLRVIAPCCGEANQEVEIAYVQPHKKTGKMTVGVRLVASDGGAACVLGQYLLQFGKHDTQTSSELLLAAKALRFRSVTDAIDFDYARTAQDYEQVLELRHKAYSQVAVLREGHSRGDWADAYDARSRILLARYRGTVVATCRLVFSTEWGHTEHSQYLSRTALSVNSEDCVEVGRLCTDPSFRGTDLLYAMIEFLTLTIAQSGHRYLLGNAPERLLPLYEKVGCKRIGQSFMSDGPGGSGEHNFVFLGDVRDMISGKVVDPVTWQRVFSRADKVLRADAGHSPLHPESD